MGNALCAMVKWNPQTRLRLLPLLRKRVIFTRKPIPHAYVCSTIEGKEMSQINPRLIINASEVGEFTYCAKAWYLRRCGAVPQGPRLGEGTSFHHKHATAVSRAARLRKTGIWLSLIGLFLLIALALILFAS